MDFIFENPLDKWWFESPVLYLSVAILYVVEL